MLNTLRITCFSSKSATVSHTNDVIFCDGQVQAFSLRIKKTDISNVTINLLNVSMSNYFQCKEYSSASLFKKYIINERHITPCFYAFLHCAVKSWWVFSLKC